MFGHFRERSPLFQLLPVINFVEVKGSKVIGIQIEIYWSLKWYDYPLAYLKRNTFTITLEVGTVTSFGTSNISQADDPTIDVGNLKYQLERQYSYISLDVWIDTILLQVCFKTFEVIWLTSLGNVNGGIIKYTLFIYLGSIWLRGKWFS